MDSLGNVVVVWVSEDQDGWGHGVFGQRYDSAANPLGPEFGVNSYFRPASTSAGGYVYSASGGTFGVGGGTSTLFLRMQGFPLPVELQSFCVE